MATLYITEVEKINQTLVDGQLVPCPQMPPIAEQAVTFTGTSAASAAFNKATRFVMINTDSTCSLAWSLPGQSDPIAVTTAQRMYVNDTRFYGVTPEGKVAAIVNT